eukprot:COSAG01_NODE_8944_length_2607_cov_5.086523_3_plen_701_part_01
MFTRCLAFLPTLFATEYEDRMILTSNASTMTELDVMEATSVVNNLDRGSAARRLQAKNRCYCLNGKPATDHACTSMNAVICITCDLGYTLNANTQACDPNVCVCPNGVPKVGRRCPVTNQPGCLSCSASFRLVNGNECKGYDCKGKATQGPGKPNKNQIDSCGVCNGDGTSCFWDCTGRRGGKAKLDLCGVCNGDSSACDDCKGIPDGPNKLDYCGTCDANYTNDCPISPSPPALLAPQPMADCNGTIGGTSYADMCAKCDNDSANDCVQDCKGFWGGKAKIDACGVCDGNGLSCAAKDCSGVPGGSKVKDVCGVCGGDGATCKTRVCNGQHGSKCDTCITFQPRGAFTISGCQNINYHILIPTICLKKGCGLIFDIHGQGISGHEQASTSGIYEAARTVGRPFIIVHPDNPRKSWSVQDHPKILQFMRVVASVYGVDKSHVHVTGFSQGGFASWNLLCLGSDLICSIAPLAAPPFGYAGGCKGTHGIKNNYQSTCFGATVPTSHAKRSILFQFGKYDLTCQDPKTSTDLVAAVHDSVTKAYGIGKLTAMTTCKIADTDRMEFYDAVTRLRIQTIKHPYTSMPPWLGHCLPRIGPQPIGRMCDGDLLGNRPQYDQGELVVNFFRNNPCHGWAGSCPNGTLIAPKARTQSHHCGACNIGYILSSAKTCLPLKVCPPGSFLDGYSSPLNKPGACTLCKLGTFK